MKAHTGYETHKGHIESSAKLEGDNVIKKCFFYVSINEKRQTHRRKHPKKDAVHKYGHIYLLFISECGYFHKKCRR